MFNPNRLTPEERQVYEDMLYDAIVLPDGSCRPTIEAGANGWGDAECGHGPVGAEESDAVEELFGGGLGVEGGRGLSAVVDVDDVVSDAAVGAFTGADRSHQIPPGGEAEPRRYHRDP